MSRAYDRWPKAFQISNFWVTKMTRALYRYAVSVIVPSVCYDASPLVTFEAFRNQTPVIARNLGMPQRVEESGGGLTYNTDQELVSAMDQLLADASYRNRLGTRGYKSFQEKWTAEAHPKSYFALVYQIAAARGQPVANVTAGA
jgi:glycosyltransferase involved in cell wall biosynthesis